MSFEIPPGLTDLLQEFTIAVLRQQPSDLVLFASEYFNNLKGRQQKFASNARNGPGSVASSKSKGVNFEGHHPDSDDDTIMTEPPPKQRGRRKSVSAEGYDPEADECGDEEKVVYPKSDEQRRRLAQAVKHIFLFRALDPEQMQEVIDAMQERKVEPGDHVIDQGDDGDNFYVIDSGVFHAYVAGSNDQPEKVGSYNAQGSFGELALMYNMPRAATIIAETEGTLWAMDRTTFRRMILKNAFNKRKMYETLLENVPMLKELSMYERMSVADALQSKTFENSQTIIKQGDTATGMYFIESGSVSCTVKTTDGEVEVSRLNQGQYFGELALITHKPRAASVYAIGTVKLAALDIEAFERLLGPCMEIMKRNIDDYEQQIREIFGANHTDDEMRH